MSSDKWCHDISDYVKKSVQKSTKKPAIYAGKGYACALIVIHSIINGSIVLFDSRFIQT